MYIFFSYVKWSTCIQLVSKLAETVHLNLQWLSLRTCLSHPLKEVCKKKFSRALSQTIWKSPVYGTDLLLSHTVHQISWIKWTFCALVWNLAHFFLNIQTFLFIVSFWAVFSHRQRLFHQCNDEGKFWWHVLHVRLHIMS